ncbi:MULTISPECIES: YaiI/YqxD family protein [Rheinheimera]|uniref:UPF0178 protein ACFO3I_06415 n=1 Tax=Rheinheimera marina TaxID=1774958 RepID=A0ABV9JK75_9GAMM
MIWLDADACPVVLREMLFRAAERTKTNLQLVANHRLPVPKSAFIRAIQVEQGFDVADHHISSAICAGDLLISNDIPLAAAVIAKGAVCLTTKGQLLDSQNISERLVVRDLADELRGSGVQMRGPAPLSQADKQQFANQLDRYLQRVSQNSGGR